MKVIGSTSAIEPLRVTTRYYTRDAWGGGLGWLRILKFRPHARSVDVFTYSPWLQEFRTEEDQQFTAEVPAMFP